MPKTIFAEIADPCEIIFARFRMFGQILKIRRYVNGIGRRIDRDTRSLHSTATVVGDNGDSGSSVDSGRARNSSKLPCPEREKYLV